MRGTIRDVQSLKSKLKDQETYVIQKEGNPFIGYVRAVPAGSSMLVEFSDTTRDDSKVVRVPKTEDYITVALLAEEFDNITFPTVLISMDWSRFLSKQGYIITNLP